MVRRAVCAAFSLMLLCSLGLRASAAEEQEGTIWVKLVGGEAAAGRLVMLYRVGEEVSDGYRIADGFGGGMVWEQDALSPYLAQWLAGMDVPPGLTAQADEGGMVSFPALKRGLYLILQVEPEDYSVIPFLIKLPCEGRWEIQADMDSWQIVAEPPKTGQHPGPLLGAAGMVLSGIGLALCAGGYRRRPGALPDA